MRLTLPLTLLLLACGEDPQTGRGQIAPLDGQTRVALDQDLMLLAPSLTAPEDAPLPPDLIQVIDLEAGGFVRGTIAREGSRIRFTPWTEWRHGIEYLWTVNQPLPEARQPQIKVPPSLLGDAVFKAGNGSAVLDAGVNQDGHICLLLSRHVSHKPASLEITMDDVPAAIGGTWEVIHEPDEWEVDLLSGDIGVSYVCWTDAPSIRDGAELRAWWGERGPWHFTLTQREPVDMLNQVRRSQW